MSSITNVNNNASIVTVGRTTPVSPGQQPASKSIPVVLASDQTAIPVEEQNKVQSEVALSLLGIPRAEVALGIFADVNTYDVNPSEWSSAPEFYLFGHGIKHLPNEAGALVETPRNKTAVLTSKRFFRYQPGRVSAATFGVKSSVSIAGFAQNPVIRKFGIYDNYDGYYWETRENGQEDNFSVVRRSQSVSRNPAEPYGNAGQPLRGISTGGAEIKVTQIDDYRICGKGEKEISTSPDLYPRDREVLISKRFALAESVYTAVENAYFALGTSLLITREDTSTFTSTGNYYEDLADAIKGVDYTFGDGAEFESKCKRDLDYWFDFFLLDLEWGGRAHTIVNISNFTTAKIPDFTNFEARVYAELSTQLNNDADLSAGAKSELTALIDLIEANLDSAANASVDFNTLLNSNGYGAKPKLDTIYDVKKNYWGYFVSSFKDAGNANPYITTDPFDYYAADDETQSTPITDPTAVIYTSALTGKTFTLAEVRYKCQRDIGYVIDGFKNDIAGGGNAETKYNMSMYYEGTGLSIASQAINEKDRHVYLKELITYDLTDKFGYTTSSAEYLKQVELSDKVISNFDVENTEAMITGDRGFAGNLVVMRDGLLMVHAGVYDPALLKEKKQILVSMDPTNNSIRLTQGIVTFGQHVRLARTENEVTTIGDLAVGGVYKVASVIGPKGNEFTLEDEGGTALQFATNDLTAAGAVYFETVVPFIFPRDYDPAFYMDNASNPTILGNTYGVFPGIVPPEDPFPVGMVFPYMYSSKEFLNDDSSDNILCGFINTSLEVSQDAALNESKIQIDAVNFIPEYINWIKNNVKPEYWGVYEYRVPRTRFSFDTLDGRTETSTPQAYRRVYSDLATGEGGIVRPGQPFSEDGIRQFANSVYNYDFTKVTMLKIEFSWYGAVGALFLAYVPVSNGEARWVRVHHLRASNQLKIASLGNATLPITYNVYGGGDSNALGDGEETNGTAPTTGTNQGYENDSHNIVKYGASYYIDGGDRGTVRLYSHNNDLAIPAYGKQWTVTNSGGTAGYQSGDNTIIINSTSMAGNANVNVDPTFFMGARLKTGNRADQNIRVVFVDEANSKLLLSSVPNDTANITLIPDRANTVYGLETKRVILSTQEGNAVRNRVQVYPTKMSSANLSTDGTTVRLRMKKTPLFQTLVQPSGTFEIDASYVVTSENLPLSSVGVTESGTYLQNNENVYGWFQGNVDGIDQITAFGRLYKEADEYYFDLLESYSGTVTLNAGSFLADKRFSADGTSYTTATKTTFEKEGLSSILISDNAVVPIPNTGTNVATLYLQVGAEQFDLSPYFDYNKEYLSFPLTDQTETLYLAVDSDQPSNTFDDISIGVTWEEQ